MYVVLVYDISKDENGQKRWSHIFKICKKYLSHIQNSVFEGMITDGKLSSLKRELSSCIVCSEDSVFVYEIQNLKYTRKESIGVNRINDNIL